jgi:hypothetical protein
MITSHHIIEMLARERTDDLQAQVRRTRTSVQVSRSHRPIRIVPRRRVHLPLIARGVARLEDYTKR